ncbi:hypothetical protein CXG81DRAFT_9837 [Caulochytrium protostelioides]|uniref:Nucleolar protein 56 n=1 Tax=Caulochytrium protostelioides TaxID=1555241 RepID=A0A4P9XDB1_9FUNG|nr:hypothetical protein CXG81DRAFT_9837 [Caulochytrium protostelioides]|eukprot:RKP03170.1 hypothetical protein CXG81DRAFT_9837 [Caulochytrium protostelioides]
MLYVLHELASGYVLFKSETQDIAPIQASVADLSLFGRQVTLVAFAPFKNAAHALENGMDISEGVVNPFLKAFLELNLPKDAKKGQLTLGVQEKTLASAIVGELGLECRCDGIVKEIVRGVRFHAAKLVPQAAGAAVGATGNALNQAQLGLGHAYSRAKVKFNVHRVDTMITQAISLLDTLDTDINTFTMRLREWYGWHFPELAKIVTQGPAYARVAAIVADKSTLGARPESIAQIREILEDDEARTQAVVDASKTSMGTELSVLDFQHLQIFTERVISLIGYRNNLVTYLDEKMGAVAPNVSALLGERIGARLIAHAGSLTNLAKMPASTVQILGAEKALFRALKTKSHTPKYGLLYHSSPITRASPRNKGRVARVLANKSSLASRLDCFLDTPTRVFGDVLREQVESRVRFLEEGGKVEKNSVGMKAAMATLSKSEKEDKTSSKDKKSKKRASADSDEAEAAAEDTKSSKKSKKSSAEKEEKAAKKSKSDKSEKSDKKKKSKA